MSNLKQNKSLPIQSSEKRKKIGFIEDYKQRKHNLSRSIKVEPTRRDYVVEGKWETFLCYEDPEKDVMSAFLVLINNDPTVPEHTSLISELRVYENTLLLINPQERKGQNQVLGLHLLQWAENIASKEHNSTQIATMNTPNNKNNKSFFERAGYTFESGFHLIKSLNPEEYMNVFKCTDGPDLQFNQNTNLIKNVLNTNEEEEQWLKQFDRDYKLQRSCSS